MFDGIGAFIGGIISAPFILIGWLIVGLLAGDIARRLMGRPDRGGCSDLVLGLAGAVVGGFIGGAFGVDFNQGGLQLVIINLVMATIGACVLIGLSRLLGRR